MFAGVAQQVEQLIRNQQVDGSSPPAGSNNKKPDLIMGGGYRAGCNPFLFPPLKTPDACLEMQRLPGEFKQVSACAKRGSGSCRGSFILNGNPDTLKTLCIGGPMYKSILSISMAAIFLFSGNALGFQLSDGTLWKRFSPEMKAAYAAGMADGIHLGRKIITDRLEDYQCRDKAVWAFMLSYSKFFSDMSHEDLIQELDRFYASEENLKVLLDEAAFIVVKRRYGIPEEYIQESLKNLPTQKQPDP